MDLLLGLDFLRRHQCALDLKANVLRVGSGEGGQKVVEVPFLAEYEIPKDEDETIDLTGDPKRFKPEVRIYFLFFCR
jgi:hypothetical protein